MLLLFLIRVAELLPDWATAAYSVYCACFRKILSFGLCVLLCLSVLRAGYGIRLYLFLIIAQSNNFSLQISRGSKSLTYFKPWPVYFPNAYFKSKMASSEIV